MQVKKYTAESIVEALTEIKRDLGPDAIILSTKEDKRVYGKPQTYTVVAAVRDQDIKVKQATEKKLGHYNQAFASKSAAEQKAIIGSVVEGIKRRYNERNPQVTPRRYIEIDESYGIQQQAAMPAIEEPVAQAAPATASSTRVKSAVKEALQSSLKSHLFSFAKPKAAEPSQDKVIELADFQKVPEKVQIKKPEQPAEIRQMQDKLKRVGVQASVVEDYLKAAHQHLGQSLNRATLEAYIAKRILEEVRCSTPDQFSGIEYFVGPEGSGKTSSLLKLASHYIMNNRRNVAIVTTDLKKVGALEQLKVYSRILNVPVIPVVKIEDWERLAEKLGDFDNVLVDTPGISLGQTEELEFLRRLTSAQATTPVTTHLVLSAMSPTNDLLAIARRFKVANYDDAIFSKIDQTSQHGVLLNFYMQTKVPFHSFGLSSDIVDGFEWATRERILDLIFRLTKLNGAKSYGQRI